MLYVPWNVYIAYLVFVVFMKVNTRLLPLLPLHWDTRIDICLMNDLGDQLRPIIDEIRTWRWDLRSRNGVCGAVFEEEGDECAECVEEETNDHQVDDEEDDRSAPHCAVRL